MEKKKVGCPFCGCEKQIGEDLPEVRAVLRCGYPEGVGCDDVRG